MPGSHEQCSLSQVSDFLENKKRGDFKTLCVCVRWPGGGGFVLLLEGPAG